MILVLREAEIRSLLDPAACLQAVEDAFTAYAAGRAETPGVLLVAVGAGQAGKQELDVAVLARADLVVADSLAQCRAIGEALE